MRLSLFLVTFFFIYGWKIKFFFDLIPILSLFLIFIVVKKYPNHFNFERIKIFFLGFGATFIYAGFVIFFSNQVEMINLQFLFKVVRISINTVGAYSLCLIYKLKLKNEYQQVLIKHVFYSLILHGVLIITMFFIPPLRILIYQMTSAATIVNQTFSVTTGLRITGLTYGLSLLSVVCIVPFFMGNYILKSMSLKVFEKIIVYLSFIVATLSLFVTGRTGIVCLIVVYPIYFWLSSQEHWWLKLRLLLIPLILSILLPIFINTIDPFSLNHRFGYLIHQLQEVSELITTGESDTTEVLLNKFFIFPESSFLAIFGSGVFNRGIFKYLHSDIGMVRQLYGIGILGLVFLFYPIFGICKIFIRKHHLNPGLSALGLSLILCMLIANMKDNALYVRNFWSIVALIYFLMADLTFKESHGNSDVNGRCNGESNN